MTNVVRYYIKPSGQFYGGWEGDPEVYDDPFPAMGFVEVPHAAPSTDWYWDFDRSDFYMPDPSNGASSTTDGSAENP